MDKIKDIVEEELRYGSVEKQTHKRKRCTEISKKFIQDCIRYWENNGWVYDPNNLPEEEDGGE